MFLRALLQSWLHSQARSRLAEAATSAAKDALDQQQARAAAAPVTGGVAVLCALSIEAGPFADKLKPWTAIRGEGFQLKLGEQHGRPVWLVITGAGRRAAEGAAEAVIAGHQPDWVISAGFAGGLRDDVVLNDLVLADEVVTPGGERATIDFKLEAHALARLPAWHVGRLLTVDRIIHLPGDKRRLGVEHGALAVDMETHAVAATCARRGVRFLAVRVISDTVDQALPRDLERLMNVKTGAQRFGAAAGALLRRPSSAKDMWRLREQAIVAAEHLSAALEGVIEQLVRQG